MQSLQRYMVILLLVFAAPFTRLVNASSGDRLPEFRACLEICQEANCRENPTPIPFHRRLLLWDCPAECDYSCQHLTTRLTQDKPPHFATHQFHGKWPFHRFMGMQEPFSVLFSLFNYLAHVWGLSRIRAHIPSSYPLRPYYLLFGYVGCMSWIASMVFHTRDFPVTEKCDYFAAGANVLYGLYFAPFRVFRLFDEEDGLRGPLHDKPSRRKKDLATRWRETLPRVWTTICISLYVLHVGYLSLIRWDYTYNMAANIAVGVCANVLWTVFSIYRYQKTGRQWQAWPGLIVTWVVLAMSLELLEFKPWGLMVDAHSLWHLGTVGPTIWWYQFLVRDALEDIQTMRWKR